MLKILVAYFSETGNTEKIARAIYDEVTKDHEADLKTIKDVNADTFNQYDLVFIGTPTHRGGMAAPVKRILDTLPKSPNYKLAGFFTHFSPLWETKAHENTKLSFERISKKKQIDYKGTYNCQGGQQLWSL